MLQRPRGLDHNQENSHAMAGPSHHNHKTPARPGKGPATVTGGKGVLPPTAGRGVLGRKDGNQGKGGGPGKDPALLFPSKPSTSSAGPSQPPSFKTPAPKPRSLRPLADLQTPATALRPKRAPVLVPSPEAERVVEVDVEAEEQAKLQAMMQNDVEYAGPSATDYEEPYEPECEVTDYKQANYGDLLRAMSFNGLETQEEWEARDAIERLQVEFPLEESLQIDSDPVEDDSAPLFPVPASKMPAAPVRRAPLASKPSQNALTSSIRSSTALPPSRKPLNPSNSSLRRPALQPSLSAPSTATRRALASSTARPIPPPQTSSLSRSTTATAARKPLAASTSSTRPASSLSQSSSQSRSRPPLLASTTRKPSFTAARPASSASALAAQKAQESKARAARKAREDAEEERLGAFGLTSDRDGGDVVDGLLLGDGVLELGAAGAFAFGDDGQSFELDLGLD
ncbi:hypothetical protein JCM11491_006205 [Sporobolomyces phaffii]